jgi:rhizosphere induced protein
MATSTSTGTIFTLVCLNESSRSGNFCVFQQDPTLGVGDARSVAWLVKAAHPTTTVTFDWTTGYDFVWSQTGELASGAVAAAVQIWEANLDTNNQVTLTCIGGAFTFENQTAGSEAGKLYVVEDSTIPAQTAAVGIGMAGAATFLAQAQPNVTLPFSPSPQIWLAFGDYVTGQVLDSDATTGAVEITYATNVYSMTAMLNDDNTWTVEATSAVNEALLLARVEDPSARWGASRRP